MEKSKINVILIVIFSIILLCCAGCSETPKEVVEDTQQNNDNPSKFSHSEYMKEYFRKVDAASAAASEQLEKDMREIKLGMEEFSIALLNPPESVWTHPSDKTICVWIYKDKDVFMKNGKVFGINDGKNNCGLAYEYWGNNWSKIKDSQPRFNWPTFGPSTGYLGR